jgi:group II intron reverse transcriptase/maturase
MPGYGPVVGKHNLHQEVRMDVYTKRQRIAMIAERHRGEPLTLLHHYIDEEWLTAAFYQLRKESAPGVDAQGVAEYEFGLEKKLKSLLECAKGGTYKAPPVRRVEIPKEGSKETRPIGIPTTEDKVLQKAVTMVLEPVYELEFYDFSYGFRRNKSAHEALEYLWKGIMDNRICWILDLDIRKFFDTVKHDILRKLLSKRVRDGVITRLINKWLKAGVLKNGNLSYPEAGTPQGGIVSPLLSNIYLHEALDKWFVEEMQGQFQGRSMMVRYADDAILGFESRKDAEKVNTAIKERLEEFGLKLHPDKTRLIYFGRPQLKTPNTNDTDDTKPGSFDFLGFTHFWARSFKGNWIVRRKTSSKKFKEKLKKMNLWLKKARHLPMEYQHKQLCRKLKGHYAYYGITGNVRSLQRFMRETIRMWKKWLSRRSWKGYLFNWEKFNEMMKHHYPLPMPKVVHSIYAQQNHNSRNRMR